jgi:hypothetical protein
MMAVALPDTSAGLKCLGVPAPEEMISVPPYLGLAEGRPGPGAGLAVGSVCTSGEEQLAALAATRTLNRMAAVIFLMAAFLAADGSTLPSWLPGRAGGYRALVC